MSEWWSLINHRSKQKPPHNPPQTPLNPPTSHAQNLNETPSETPISAQGPHNSQVYPFQNLTETPTLSQNPHNLLSCTSKNPPNQNPSSARNFLRPQPSLDQNLTYPPTLTQNPQNSSSYPFQNPPNPRKLAADLTNSPIAVRNLTNAQIPVRNLTNPPIPLRIPPTLTQNLPHPPWSPSQSYSMSHSMSPLQNSPPPPPAITSSPDQRSAVVRSAPLTTTTAVYPPAQYPVIRSAQPGHRLSPQSGSTSGSLTSSPGSQNNSPQGVLMPQPSNITFRHKTSTSAFSPVAQRALHVDTHVSTPGDVVPVLLSPVLSRPVRSLSAQHSFVRQTAVSDSETELSCVINQRRTRSSRPSDSSSSIQTPPRCISPAISHSALSSRLSACCSGRHLHGSGNGSPLLGSLTRSSLKRSDSDSVGTRRRAYSSAQKIHRKRSGMHSQTSVESSCSGHTSVGSMVRMRHSSMGHSDPQISASTAQLCPFGPVTSTNIRLRRDMGHQSVSSSRAVPSRRSFNASTSPILAQRCRSPGRSLLQSAGGTASTSTAKTLPLGVPLRSYSTRSGSNLIPAQHSDNRRWSVASLPSSSGYGTPGSNSAFSSEYSSQEQLCDMLNDLRVGAARFDSNESYPFMDDLQPRARPRSRSLTSPVKLGYDPACDVIVRSTVYKERFPKAKQQMEERLLHFIEENAPLSGISTSSIEASNSSRPVSPSLSTAQGSLNMSTSSSFSRKSMVIAINDQPGIDPALIRLIADGATRFIHHQVVEIASDCLSKSRDDMITCAYFCEMSQRLEETLTEAHDKTSPESFTYLSKLVRSLLMIVSRPARLLECLEFDPDEFYHLLEEAEGAVREQLGSGSARVPDLPQYIISKLGLDRDPLSESQDAELIDSEHSPVMGSSFEGPLPSTDPNTRLPTEDDYENIRLISNGAYGAVYLVRHRETRQRFALKRMNKQTLIMRNQVDQVYAERDILTFTDNPFVVSFYGSFETRHHLCMLMEYVEGGDCAALLKNVGTLPIDLARLYIAETILAIDYLHSYGIVHRDLKPDNLLITAMGHIKLTDFGLSKIGLMNRTTLVSEGCLDVADTQQFKDKQLCGTPEYIAPEVILRQGYGKPVDWWAMGIIIYEFLIGIVPFMGETPEQLFDNIINEEVEFPEGEEALPQEAESLISQLLEKNPAERLGTMGGSQQLAMQPFFDGLDFKSLLRQKAEFVPQLTSEEDTSYFDARTDRYNHDAESGEDESTPMFGSFSTASPRHSIVGLDPNMIMPSSCLMPSPVPTTSTSTMSSSATLRGSRTDSDVSMHQQSSDSLEGHSFDNAYDCPIPTAVLLRRRFSAQRQTNLSTSSSGTTGTGCMNTACSSTDSSMDASALGSDLPRKSPLPTENPARRTTSTPSPLPRFAISCEPVDSSSHVSDKKELSPVEESKTVGETSALSETGSDCSSAGGSTTTRVQLRGGGTAHVSSSGTLQLVIPGSAGPHPSQQSPAGSVSSASSQDGSSPNPPNFISQSPGASTIVEPSTSPHICSLKPPIIIKRGPKGFGFMIHSMRVYINEHSDMYTIEHAVSEVDERSPAYEAGLRRSDLITHVNSVPVSNITHPQLMNRLLAYGNELSIKVTPMSATTIREGAARKTVGKLVKRKPKRPQRRVPLEKKTKKPSSLLRRLSGKRTNNDIVPGSSSQKQSFMPRSVSSQDGIQLSNRSGVVTSMAPSCVVCPSQVKVLTETGLSGEDVCTVQGTSPLVMPPSASRPSTLQGLKHKVAGMAHQLTARKHTSSQMPVSPLARHENISVSPPRSPSPSVSRISMKGLLGRQPSK